MVITYRSVARCLCTAAVLGLVATLFATGLQANEADTRADKVLDGFVKQIEQNADLDETQRTAVLELIEKQRTDEYLRIVTISEALATLHPEFQGALEALAEEETQKAIKTLAELAKSKDLYLSAEASYYLARAHMMEERCEDALPLLQRLTGDLADKTLFAGNSQYLLGTSHAYLLQRKKAIASLKTFLKNNPNASERLRVGAFRQIAQLESVQKGSLDDVQDRMNFSRRKLALEDSGSRTRGEQDNIIAMLDVLIKEAEDKEKKGGT